MVDFARLYVVIRIFIPDTSDKDCLALCSEKKQMNKREINPKETRGHKRSNKRHLKHTEGERRSSRILLYIWITQWHSETPIRSGNKGNLKLNSFRKLLAVFKSLSFTSWHFSGKPGWHRLISFFFLFFLWNRLISDNCAGEDISYISLGPFRRFTHKNNPTCHEREILSFLSLRAAAARERGSKWLWKSKSCLLLRASCALSSRNVKWLNWKPLSSARRRKPAFIFIVQHSPAQLVL